MDWLKGFDSASFSVARCSRPMCGSAFWITSPSISSTSRSTPCAAGCCGPKFSVKFWISDISVHGRRDAVALLADHLRHGDARLDGHRLVDDAPQRRVIANLDPAGQRKVLAEWMADEAVVGEDPAQVRMAAEQHAEQVEGLALEPVGRSPDVHHRVDHRRLAGQTAAAQAQ